MTTDPIRKSIEVPLPPLEAFDLFTQKMETWWPLESHGVGADTGAPSSTIRVDQEEGGAVTEILPDGKAARWGTILEYAPGEAFRMTWHPGREERDATQVSITFRKAGNGCRVELVHDGFARHTDGVRAAHIYAQGWDHLLGILFARAAGRLISA
ncbi:MAG: SRPBCC domain-containing protein [Pseudomonadota bacterium]